MTERPDTHGETAFLDSAQAAELAYASLLERMPLIDGQAEDEPAIPEPRGISQDTIKRVQSYLDNTADQE